MYAPAIDCLIVLFGQQTEQTELPLLAEMLNKVSVLHSAYRQAAVHDDEEVSKRGTVT